ncbi:MULTISPECIES: YolD-like family protein [unclassified Planococcus (in: firmicutes)]|uniref:YolD-like family protein n=1 Tax=unclassified Planococcus (in: firmicutes) TaxID=2662419 RepID=UPI000C31F362|nr:MULTISPECIES: YolD-like family protein [unclassified Planococcus (in: firmicutes)]AUD12432.1 YolD-like family protein [Planococcus sp. MB-3u-03]PKG47137.1 YolD-like family protein [Planococcus sp. Urea-trap-24]PKG87667.1 YolD-like family protein [Planococcus sp. Urea-3u-39]PKG87734.1 YolD-like family protein [Planococcus sp. Urea-3u-39]PKH40402.1 YolD-like family protein [Planococcus sp. MB-3u-09]
MKTTKHTKQVGAVSDRGLIKWQGMLLTEHVRLIKAFYEEEDQVSKPELTEFDLQAIQEEVEIAMSRRCEVQLKTWKNGAFFTHTGVIQEIDLRNGQLVYEDTSGRQRLPVESLVGIQLVD